MKKILLSIFTYLLTVSLFAQLTSDGFYRIKNYGSGYYFWFCDNTGSINYQTTSADLGAMQLWNGLDLAISEPASVLNFSKVSGDYWNMETQGSGIYDIIQHYVHVNNLGEVNGDILYQIYAIEAGISYYLSDQGTWGGDYRSVGTTGTGSYTRWVVEPIDANTNNYFGIEPTLTCGDKYYAPFYADFAFSFASEGMKAYTVSAVEGNVAVIKLIESEVIPQSTPVIIECSYADKSKNRLNLLADASAPIADNKLSGVYFCNEHRVKSKDAITAFNASTMRVLHVNAEGKLVFDTATTDLHVNWYGDDGYRYLNANQSYLPVSAGTPEELVVMTETEYAEYVQNPSIEPYAVLSNNNSVLTFYYDHQKEARNGISVGSFNSATERSWNDYCSYITSVVFDASFANCTTLTSTRYWFAFCRNLTTVTGISNLNTENVKDMGCMFEGCTSLKSLDLSTLNTDKALYMDMMFYNCSSLTSLDLSGFNTSNVTDMGLMFYSCPGLTSLDLSSFNTNNVTRMDHMFEKCSSLTKIIVSKDWSTAKVAESDYMFTDCTKLVGGKGTKYNTNYTDKTYAHIDGGTGNPGYFTDKNAATICDTPQITRDGTSNRIIINCATEGASIYYTTNGTTPTANNTRYTGSITVSQNCVIKAIAVKEGYDNSSVATYNVNWFKVATPTFSYNNLQLTISTTTEGATIYYTTNGSTPTTSSTKYTGPLSLTENTTVKAIAVKEDFNNSDVATYNFVKDDQTCQTPQVSRDGTSNRVVMTCGTSGASIYYTTDNSAPTSGSTLYTGPITVNRNLTIRAIAMKDGMFNSSQSLFDVDWFKVESPTFTYTNLQLIISTTTSGASIYYTTNGSDPLADLSRAILFTAPVRLESDAVVKAVAVKTDFSNSEVATFTFVKADYTCQQPEIKRDGTSDRLMMSCEEANAQIYYTIDGSTPTTSSLRYTGPITMPYNCTVRAIAARSDLFPSEVSEFIVDWLTVSAVSVAYNNGVLTLSCATEGAEIHYAIGGSDATKESPLYTGPITLTDNREVRYVVYASGYAPISGSYTPTDFACAPATLTYDGLNIELTTTEKDASIYYTTDGSIPTTLSARYTGKTPLTGLCTISAIVVKQYKNNSEVMMEPVTYYFDGATVYLAASGHVEDALKWRGTDNLEYLTIECQGQSGALSATDTKFIRTIQDLKHLNMANARFENNTIPDGAFNDMNIVSIEFPSKNITTTGNVFSGCKHLAAIIWNARVVMAPTAAAAGITNPNLLLYVDNKVYAPQGVRNVIANGSASSIVLTDEEGGSYYCPQAFQAQSISYTHTYNQKTGMNECRGWETIALPFDVQTIKHETAGRIVPFAAKDETARSFWLGELDYSGFKKASEIKAYTPYIVSMPNNEVYGNSYILSGKVTFEAVNTTVPVTDIKTTSKGDHVFTPCFDHVEASPMVYAINKNDQGTNFAEGSVFLPSYREVQPFEAYISIPSNGVAPRYIPIRDNDETGIMELQNIGIMELQNGTYDLTGRKVQGELKRGVYIIDGKKVMVK